MRRQQEADYWGIKTHAHVLYAHARTAGRTVPGFYCGSLSEWTRAAGWLSETWWYHGRRGGANRVSLNLQHMPSSSLLLHQYRRLWLARWGLQTEKREECRADCPPVAVPWCIYTCKSSIGRTGLFLWILLPWVVLIRLTDLCRKKRQREIRCASLQHQITSVEQ